MDGTPPRVKIGSKARLRGETHRMTVGARQVDGQINIADAGDGFHFVEFSYPSSEDSSVQDWVWLSQEDVDDLNSA